MASQLKRKPIPLAESIPEGLKPVVNESGIEIKPLYTADDVTDSQIADERPGAFPFTRGIHPEMYRKRWYTLRQYTGFSNAKATNERFHYLIKTGNTGLNVAFDLPSQCGIDSDDPRAEGEVGRVGMAVDSLRDFEIAFDGVDLDKITVSLTINGSAAIMIAMYLAMARKKGFDVAGLRGTAQNDILKEFVGRGTWIFPVEPSVKLIGDTIEYCAQYAPKYSPVSVCGYHIRESGCDPVEEMAYGICIAKAYIDETVKRGVPAEEFVGRLSFNFDIFGSIFEQVAKFRAGRRLWAKVLAEDYGVTDPNSMWLRMIAGGGGFGLTIEQPENNIVRGTMYALIASLAGCQTTALCCYDEAYTIPSPKAQQIALRTNQILMEEGGLADTVDPLAGSYYIESLTDTMEAEMRKVTEAVDSMGGIKKLIADGTLQDHVSQQAYEYERRLESGEFRKVGVNCYTGDVDADQSGDGERKTHDVEMHENDPADLKMQIESVAQVKKERDQQEVDRTLVQLKEDAIANRNLMPTIMDAVTAYATVGEITNVLADVYGYYQEPIRFEAAE